MSQEYEIIQVDKSDFQDNHGNYWVTVAFKGVSEPVKWVVKDPSKLVVGEKVTGDISEQTSKAGKPYLRFKKEYLDKQQTYTPNTQDKPSEEYWEEKNATIRAQWAIGQAMGYYGNSAKEYEAEGVEVLAKELFNMVDKVKQPTAPQEITSTEAGTVDKEVEEELAKDEPIDLKDIPF